MLKSIFQYNVKYDSWKLQAGDKKVFRSFVQLIESTASAIPAALKPLIIISSWLIHWVSHLDIGRLRTFKQLFRNLFCKPGVVLVGNKRFSRFVYSYVEGLKIICEVVRNDNNMAMVFHAQLHDHIIVLPFESIRYNQ